MEFMGFSCANFVSRATVLAAVSGCLGTCHVENHREVYTSYDSSGAVNHTDSTVHSERSWLGPWLGLPSQVVP